MKKVSVLNIDQFHGHNSPEDFYSNTLQHHLLTRHKDINLPHSHNFYLAILFTHGTGLHEVDFTTYQVKPGALFFLNPGQTHHWELSNDTKGYIFFHTRSFYELHYTNNKLADFPFYYSIYSKPCHYLGPDEHDIFIDLFKKIYDEDRSTKNLKRQYIISAVDMLYIESTRLYLNQNPGTTQIHNPYYFKYRQFESLVEQHFKTEKSPSVYADMMAVTARHLNRIVQAATGKSAGDVIISRILLEAKKLLVLNHENFSQIAFALGYDDYAYFSRLFKQRVGETPSAFLARYLKS
jgi:AraC family transcriptional activator of pobA